jgi:hypothetical protein
LTARSSYLVLSPLNRAHSSEGGAAAAWLQPVTPRVALWAQAYAPDLL